MKICIISNDFPSPGIPRYVFVEQLVNHLLVLGIEVVIIAPQSITHCLVHHKSFRPIKKQVTSPYEDSYLVYRPFVISIGNYYGYGKGIFNYFLECAIQRVITKIKPDVVYCHFWEKACSIYKYTLRNKLPLFVACGEGDNAIENMVSTLSPKEIQNLASAVTGVISVSTENKRKCLDYKLCKEENIIVLRNCVDTNIFKEYESLSKREELGIEDRDFVIAFCGDFTERKGAKRVSDAITKLNDSSIKSIFIGKPSSWENLTPSCNGIVHIGAIEHDKIPQYLNCADVFVLPTLKEGCCNAIVEALACGLPVVSSNGAFNDDILDETNSIRVDPNNIDEIADAILSVRNSKNLKKQIHERLSTDNPYSLRNRASKIVRFINDLLE